MRIVVPTLVLAFAAAPALAAADPVMGTWLTEDGMGKVEVAPCHTAPALACGAITWLKDPVGHPNHDVNNPDKALRGRPLVGVLVVRDMKNQGPGRWVGGKLYDPKTGKTYAGKLKAAGPGKLNVEGCVLVVCEDETWTRAD